MVIKEIREILEENYSDSLLFDNPSFDRSILGVSTNGEIIYSLTGMIGELMQDENMTEQDALEFIDYNTLRAVDYFKNEGVAPVVLDDCSGTTFEIEEIHNASRRRFPLDS